ncbi:MAG: hypothetical protein HYR58_01090, partial [Acidobacteria bacterium]|nr:hypothetical protein [Acidobacteriota bacterium]
MADHLSVPTSHPPPRVELETYSADIQLSSLPVGIDNIHYDVALSPRFVEFAQKYVLDLVKHHANLARFFGSDTKKIRAPETGAFKKLLTDLLQAGLTRAKFEKNIELDFLLRLAVLKFLTQEIPVQFANALLECKEWIRSRGEYFERSEKALLFAEGARDDFVCLEHYVLLGNFQRDLDRFETVDALFFEFLRDSVSAGERGDEA